jgi:hypothetical protein
MNWNYWLPWRSYPADSEDSTYENRVIDRCDHQPESRETKKSGRLLTEPELKNGFVVFKRVEQTEWFCTNCGARLSWPEREMDGKIAVEVSYEIEEGNSIEDVLEQPESGGRVIVNESEEESGYKITD